MLPDNPNHVEHLMTIQVIDYPEQKDRCQSNDAKGQCNKVSMAESKYCQLHGGNKATEIAERSRMSNYRVAKWNARIQEKVNAPALKDLRDEIGILRILLEETLERCTDKVELLLASHQISKLVGDIERLVTSCHKLEKSTGSLLDETAVMQFAGLVIGIVGQHVAPGKLSIVSNEIMLAIDSTQAGETLNVIA